jgi:hypothetical protein
MWISLLHLGGLPSHCTSMRNFRPLAGAVINLVQYIYSLLLPTIVLPAAGIDHCVLSSLRYTHTTVVNPTQPFAPSSKLCNHPRKTPQPPKCPPNGSKGSSRPSRSSRQPTQSPPSLSTQITRLMQSPSTQTPPTQRSPLPLPSTSCTTTSSI